MSTNATSILLRNNYTSIVPTTGEGVQLAGPEAIATILMNLAYYGKALSVEAYNALTKLGKGSLVDWWVETEKELKEITGANRKIEDFVVYKNFPAEVLEKSAADYWIPQILIYWGFPDEMFTEEVQPRIKMDEKKRPLVLRLAKQNTLKEILDSYIKAPAR